MARYKSPKPLRPSARNNASSRDFRPGVANLFLPAYGGGMSDTYQSAEHHHPWDRIPGEPDRAFRAFECYLDMPYWERKDLHAYRNYTGNPNAPHVSTTWSSWKEEFFWEERA